MLLSMTGYGEARFEDQHWMIQVEVRTVNNRHVKLSAKISDPYGSREADVEQLVREKVKRGSVQLNLRVERPRRPEDYRLNLVALSSYREQLKSVHGFGEQANDLTQLLMLPGVVEDCRLPAQVTEEDWSKIASVVSQALDQLHSSRAAEGRAMAGELTALAREISEQLGRIAARGPAVVLNYQKRLTERIQNLLGGQGSAVEPHDFVREVAILADRCDISEEIVRLRAHLNQYIGIIEDAPSSGRKLEFVVQEMAREINTIGSKANDVEISLSVVEVKALLEKIRELVQNVE
ncbi:MAG: YicC/YloC family endoribonuclease [Isosphaeraceae bacterium]